MVTEEVGPREIGEGWEGRARNEGGGHGGVELSQASFGAHLEVQAPNIGTDSD